MRRTDLIWKLIVSAAVALTMLPVQARAEGNTHSLTYAVEGNVLTETCTDEACGHTAKATLILDSEASLVYTGQEITPLKVEVTQKKDAMDGEPAVEGWLGGELTIAYANNTNAGTATGSITMQIPDPEDSAEEGQEPVMKDIVASLEFTIEKARMQVTAVGNAVYDGQPHGISFTGAPEGAKIEYAAEENGEYTIVAPTRTDVGTTTVWYRITKDNYEDVTGSADIVITARELKVTAEADAIEYGAALPELKPRYDGFAEGEDAAVLSDTPVLTCQYRQYNAPGEYSITVSIDGMTAANYSLEAENGILKVNPKELEVKWEGLKVPYDGNAHIPKATVTGTVNNEVIQTSVTGEQTAAGTYTAILTISGDAAGNYALPDDGKVQFEITKAAQAAPTGLKAVPETILNYGDGKITDVTEEMEYKLKGADSYTKVSGTEIVNLKSGTYQVRYAAKDNYAASADAEVTVTAEKKLTITLPKTQMGYTLTADKTEVGYGDNVTLEFTPAAGMVFSVKVDSKEITRSQGKYTIENIQEDKDVTVDIVSDNAAPTVKLTIVGTIAVDGKTEYIQRETTEVVDDIVFTDVFKKVKVKIAAEDASGIECIEYYESDKNLDPHTITDWKKYNAEFDISKRNEKLVIYVKVTDIKGKIAYASSNGMILDATFPKIGVSSTTQYTTQIAKITEANMGSVTVNGVAVEIPIPENGTELKLPVTVNGVVTEISVPVQVVEGGLALTLKGNMDVSYQIRVIDKAGYPTSTTVDMDPIDKLKEYAQKKTADTVAVNDEKMIKAILNGLETATEEEKELLGTTEEHLGVMLKIIEVKKVTSAIDAVTTSNMKPTNKETVQDVLTKVEAFLKKSPTAEQKKLLEAAQDKCEELLSNVNYSITTDEDDLKWTKSSGDKLIVKTDAGSAELKELWIAGRKITKATTNYEYKDGTLTIKAACLQNSNVKVGKQTIKLVFEDGETDANDKIEILKAGTNPKTGDGSHVAFWGLAAGVSLAGLAAVVRTDRKKKHQV